MIKPIVRDEFFLRQKSEPASKEDMDIGKDLADTLGDNAGRCVGMAANMIGVKKRIIIVNMGVFNMVMYNPVITKKTDPYDTEEGCLSLNGVRKTKRYRHIAVDYYDMNWKKQHMSASDHTAQIIQHEIDHCDGILI